MAYSNNPLLPKARASTLKLLLFEGLTVESIAAKSGIHRTTLWRWHQKWLELNREVEFTNPNRPSRPVSLKHKLSHCSWQIATLTF